MSSMQGRNIVQQVCNEAVPTCQEGKLPAVYPYCRLCTLENSAILIVHDLQALLETVCRLLPDSR